MAIQQIYDLNLIPQSDPLVIHCSQYDIGESRLKFNLYVDKLAYTPASGAIATIEGTKPDKHIFINAAEIDGSSVIVDLTEQMTAVAGYVMAKIRITEGNDQTGSWLFVIDVQVAGAEAGGDMSESDLSYIRQLLDEAEHIQSNVPIIGDNGNWYIYNPQTEEYEDTERPSRGATGPTGPQGPQGPTGAAAGFGTPTASVDANVGTPSVNISASGPDTAKVFNFEFHNMKGETGATGPQGPQGVPGFGSVSYDAEEELIIFTPVSSS